MRSAAEKHLGAERDESGVEGGCGQDPGVGGRGDEGDGGHLPVVGEEGGAQQQPEGAGRQVQEGQGPAMQWLILGIRAINRESMIALVLSRF